MIGGRDPADRRDWSSTMSVLLAVIVVLALTFEFRAPHSARITESGGDA